MLKDDDFTKLHTFVARQKSALARRRRPLTAAEQQMNDAMLGNPPIGRREFLESLANENYRRGVIVTDYDGPRRAHHRGPRS